MTAARANAGFSTRYRIALTDQWSAIVIATTISWCFVRFDLGVPAIGLGMWLMVYPLARQLKLPSFLKWLNEIDNYLTQRTDSFLLGFVITGVIVIVSFGFGQVLPLNPFYVRESAESWMRGSVIWTMLMAVYYVNFAAEIRKGGARLVIWACLIIFAVSTYLLLGIGPGPGVPAKHVWLAALVTLLMCVIDVVVADSHPSAIQKEAASKSLLFADLPPLIAFLLLGLYVGMRPGNSRVFVSGAIAFQLFSGKVIFTAIEADAKARERSDSEPLAAFSARASTTGGY